MDQIRAKLNNSKSFKGLTNPNSPVKAVHFNKENQTENLSENDKKI